MSALCLKRAFTAAAASIAFAASAQAGAAGVSLRSLAAEQVGVATIAYRLGAANANLCTDQQMLTGMVVHDLSQYDPGIRPAVARAFALGGGIGVIQIVPGSAAERAGLRIDDEIVAVGNQSVVDPAAIAQRQKSYARMDRFSALLQRALASGTTELVVRRADRLLRVDLHADRGCGGQLSMINSREQNAWSDGAHVMVTSGMMRLARSKDELAFVIAHEMAHNILGHSRTASEGIFGLGFGISRARRAELDADQFAVRIVSAAGYTPLGGISFLQAAQRRFWWSVSLDHPGFQRRIRAVSAAMASLAPPKSAYGVASIAPAVPAAPAPAVIVAARAPSAAINAAGGTVESSWREPKTLKVEQVRPVFAFFPGSTPRMNCQP